MIFKGEKVSAMKRNAGFTLVELLVVIAILGVLMAMMVPAASYIVKRAKTSTARTDAGIVVSVMMKYRAEYNRWPEAYKDEGGGITDKDWVALMAPQPGTPSLANPKRVQFFEAGGGALNEEGAFADPWGNAYQFIFDKTGAGELQSPNEESGEIIRGSVAAWSAGPDGNFETWDDNVSSWE